MANKPIKRSKKTGLPPGTLIHIGEKKTETVRITVFEYGPDGAADRTVKSAKDCVIPKDGNAIRWINVDGLHDVQWMETLGASFDIHPLILEDILNTGQRPKLEEAPGYLFLVLRMLRFEEAAGSIQSEQVSMILGPNYVLSFQEAPGDVFDAVRDRIRTGRGRIRNMGTDYLVYALMDAVVDGYFGILEKLGERVEVLEQEVIGMPDEKTLQKIYALKRALIYLRKSVWPLREVVGGLVRSESERITDATSPYFRDVYDHTIQVIDTVETLRDMVSGLLDIYLSSISNRMNSVMKVLTIIATIFIPLTFIAGVYGMNFEWMPELSWKWAYPAVWGVMGAVFVGMLIYFKKKKWL